MKNLIMISSLVIAATVLSACDKVKQNNAESSVVASSAIEFRVNNWGPQSTKAEINPNKQPDGSMGIWIEVSGAQGLGEVQVLFSGNPAKSTSVQGKLITAAIGVDQLSITGDKEIAVKQIETGKIFSVGTFKVINK